MKNKILVWDLPTRLFHWLLATSFIGAYLTSESERLRNIHVMLGYTLIGLIAFRLIWGFIGSRYARFSEFVRGPARVLEYMKSLLTTSPKHYIGHNPVGSVAVVLLLGLGVMTGLSGYLTYQEIGGDAFEEIHEIMANLMMTVVVAHVGGVIFSSRLHKENLVKAMLDGQKEGPAAASIKKTHPLVAILMLFAVAAGWFFGLSG
ncbi:MAG TPA: cytochrome b/b6 domain-containing protein [Pseudomonadales bacterium]|nr:cytochrome b/b6 domain-containing protein [Pseudomonadales bacterium]